MEPLSCTLSPLVFAKLYRLLAKKSEWADALTDRLEQVHLGIAWLSEAADSYQVKWQNDLDNNCLTEESIPGSGLSVQHAEMATWILASLHRYGSCYDLQTALQSEILEDVTEPPLELQAPLPPELSPVVIGWTLGRVVGGSGHDAPVMPAIVPDDENARAAYEGLVEHVQTLQSLPEPWPEMMCTAMYWRGYGLAEALRPEYGDGHNALVQLRNESSRSMPEHLKRQVGRHLDTFGKRRNALSHIADDPRRERFVDVIESVRAGDEYLNLTMRAMSQFVFQEVARSLQERRPKSVRPGVWDNLVYDLDVW